MKDDARRYTSREWQPPPDPLLDGFVFDGEGVIEPPSLLIKDIAPAEGILFIGGQSGAGKTFVVIDGAVALSSQQPFFGRRIRDRVGVAILAGEGFATIAAHVEAAKRGRGIEQRLPIAWLGAVPNLSDPKEIDAMIPRLAALDAKLRADHGVRLGAVILDTLAATFSLSDENDNSEAAKIIRQIRRIGDAAHALMIPVHHYGKGQETGLRGASGWRAGCDVVLSVLCDRNEITGESTNRRLALAKSRVSQEGPIAPFKLQFVELGIDEDGEPFGSCYVVPELADSGAKRTQAGKLSRATRTYIDACNVVLGDRGERTRPFLDGPEINAVDRDLVRAEFYARWPADGDTEAKRQEARRKRFNSGEAEALDRKLVCTREIAGKTLVWRLQESMP